MDDILSTLNPEQYAAVCHDGSPLLILAGAGSGKTRVITTKIAWRISKLGAAPQSILAATFTNKAAREMKERATALEPEARFAEIRTFHSFGARFLRRYAGFVGLDPGFTIYDDEDSAALLAGTAPDLPRVKIKETQRKIARAKDFCLLPDSPDLSAIDPDEEFRLLYSRYEKRLRETGVVDFGDLILTPVKALRENAALRKEVNERFRVILVDEYQDTNAAQFEFLKLLAGGGAYLCAVGDDDQSIYRFRGAEIGNILSFEENFPGTQIVRLERNYRSTPEILAAANEVIAHNSSRLGKTLRAARPSGQKPALCFLPNQDEEAEFCAELIRVAVESGSSYRDWAILYRTNAQSLTFESAFLRKKIPYQVVGALKFYEREEIKDALAYINFIANRKDEVAFKRAANIPRRGVGKTACDKTLALAPLYGGDILAAAGEVSGLRRASREGLDKFRAIIKLLSQILDEGSSGQSFAERLAVSVLSKNPPEERGGEKDYADAEGLARFVRELLEYSGLQAYYEERDKEEGTARAESLLELPEIAKRYELSRGGLTEFLEHIELDQTALERVNGDSNTDAVALITVHNTKGLEFPRVIMTGLEYGVFPNENKIGADLEEERRLMYVGITRARDELYLTSCAARRIYGRLMGVEPSPFLFEINSDKLEIIGDAPRSFRARGNRNAAETETDDSEKFLGWKRGQRVYSDDYGYGGVLSVDDEEGEIVIAVQFETGAIKRFFPRYQSNALERIGSDE